MKLLSFFRKLSPKAWFGSPYESANASPKRGRVPGSSPRDSKLDLSPRVRSELVRRSRYLLKNSGFARELVGSMAIYSVGDGLRPQAQSSDPSWNRQAEEYFRGWASRPEVTGRFSFEECQAIICRGMDTDGEFFVHKTRSRSGLPLLQLIESHRIGDTDGEETWACFGSWIRTIRPGIPPSEQVVGMALSHCRPEFLASNQKNSDLVLFIRERIAPDRAEGLRLVA